MSNRIRSTATFIALGAMLSLSFAAAGPRRVDARPAPSKRTPPLSTAAATLARGDSTQPAASTISRFADALRGLSGSLFARFVSPAVKTPAVPRSPRCSAIRA